MEFSGTPRITTELPNQEIGRGVFRWCFKGGRGKTWLTLGRAHRSLSSWQTDGTSTSRIVCCCWSYPIAKQGARRWGRALANGWARKPEKEKKREGKKEKKERGRTKLVSIFPLRPLSKSHFRVIIHRVSHLLVLSSPLPFPAHIFDCLGPHFPILNPISISLFFHFLIKSITQSVHQIGFTRIQSFTTHLSSLCHGTSFETITTDRGHGMYFPVFFFFFVEPIMRYTEPTCVF